MVFRQTTTLSLIIWHFVWTNSVILSKIDERNPWLYDVLRFVWPNEQYTEEEREKERAII